MMISVKGKFKNGVAMPEKPIQGHDDQEVIITFLDHRGKSKKNSREAELLQNWQAASSRSLQEVWDNDDDAAYDEL